MSNELLWYTSRATGTASIVLLTGVVILGATISGRGARSRDGATIVTALHRWLSLGMTVFLLLHVATAVVETYVSIDLVSAVFPFTSGYEPLWVGLGTLAFDLFVADIPKWLAKAGHRLVGVTEHGGFDEIVVEKMR